MKLQDEAWLKPWHVNPSANKDYDVIDGLRGVAILLVLGCHLFYVNPLAGPTMKFIGGLFTAGASGVTVFFALSGFLISWPFWKRKVKGATQVIPTGYGWRRFWKIYPPLALSALLLTPFYMLHSFDNSYPGIAARWLAGLPLFVPISGKLNPVMWSLIVESHFYIILPLLFVCLKKVPARVCLWILPLLFLVVPNAFRLWNYRNGVEFTIHPDINVHFPSLLDSFALGVLLAGLENMGLIRKGWAKLGDVGMALLVLSLFGASWFSLHPLGSDTFRTELFGWTVKIASAFLICYIADPQHPRTRLFGQPWLRWCGIISYEWYLFHQPIILWTRNAFGPAGGSFITFGLTAITGLLLGLIIAALVYRCFSLPILKYGRGKNAADPPRNVEPARQPEGQSVNQ